MHLFTSSFIHSFNYLLTDCYMAGTVLGASNTTLTRTSFWPLGTLHSSQEAGI